MPLQAITLAAVQLTRPVQPPQCPAGLLPASYHHAQCSQLLQACRLCWKALICHTMQGCYQLFWLFLIIYGAPARISRYHVTTECQTMTMLHTDEYAGSTSINLSNVTTTPPYRSLDLCCSGTDCYEGGLYYQGGGVKLHVIKSSALFNGRLEACRLGCMNPGVYLMAILCTDKQGFAVLPLQEQMFVACSMCSSTAVQTSLFCQPGQPAQQLLPANLHKGPHCVLLKTLSGVWAALH